MANYPQISYDTSNTPLYATDLYGGTDADLDNTAPVDDTDGYTSTIDLSSKIGAKIAFKFTASGSTDKLVLKLYTALSSTWDGDEELIDEIEVNNDGSETIRNYTINALQYEGPGYYRFSMQSESSNDTFDILVECRYWRGEIATS
jgi:hypothetical protein